MGDAENAASGKQIAEIAGCEIVEVRSVSDVFPSQVVIGIREDCFSSAPRLFVESSAIPPSGCEGRMSSCDRLYIIVRRQ